MPLESVQIATVDVADQDAALRFYTETLGVEVVNDGRFGDGQRFLTVAPPGGGTELALMPPDETHAVGGMTGIVFGSSDVEATHRELADRGVAFPQPPARQEWGAMMGLFTDPDGNVFVLHDRS